MVSIPPHIFREYDIRGVADRDLSDDLSRNIGRAIATMFLGDARAIRIAVGRDCRLSSPRIFAALTDGLRECGADVVDIGIGPTPFLYHAVTTLDVHGGVMITGSHNAGDENGFKIMRGKASFFGADIQALRAVIEAGAWQFEKRGSLESVATEDAYVASVTGGIRIADKSVRVVLDAGNGSGGPLGLRCMRELGLEPTPLFCAMDGEFPNHHPDPTVAKNLEALVDCVRKTNADIGIAYDGDADRLGAVDSDGTIIWGDKLMILFARDLLKANPGATIIGEVKCSQTLYDDVAKHGGRPIMWKTGHSLIKTKMKSEKALLAGEMSGHLFFADRYFGYDDAIYASLRLIEIVARERRSLRAMLADVPNTFATPEIRVACSDSTKFAVVARVAAHFKAAGLSVDEVDGARIQFGAEGWGLVRASNTGPLLVMRFEAGSEAECARIRGEVEAATTAARAAVTV